MDKLGVERRLYTAGENKDFLDPFSPVRASDVEHANLLLKNIHEQFVNAVRKGRGDRLQKDPELYSGLVWTGQESLELGLVDGMGSSAYVARELIGAEDIVDFTEEPDLLKRLGDRIGVSLANSLGQVLGTGGSVMR
jgi:protease-4